MWVTLFLAFVFTALLLYKLCFANDKKFDWKSYGVREINTSAAFKRLDLFLGRKPLTDADDYAYSQMGPSDKFCGITQMGSPLLLIKDTELIKKVLIKDFEYFLGRRQVFTSADGPLKKMLPNLEGDEWKGVRTLVSPTFSTGKIRRMMEHFNEIGLEWVEELTRIAKLNPAEPSSSVINVRDVVNQYTIEVISNTVFGMEANAIKKPQSIFSKMASRASQFNTFQITKLALRLNFPKLSDLLGFSIVHRESLAFFEEILKQGLKSRMSGEIQRNDFLQLLVEAKRREQGFTGMGEEETFFKDDKILAGSRRKQYLTDEIMNAQSVVFFFAGYNSTNHLITFTLYALALYQSVQAQLREEVKNIVKEDGTFEYDDITRLVYLDMVICEVQRKFPSGSRLERICSKEYRDADNGLVIPKGMAVGIPVNGIHKDRQYYDNPDEFDPEHFSPEKKANRSPYAFMPFGMGQRNCIGMRFAMIMVKSAVAHIVNRFIIEPTAKTPVPLQGRPTGLQLVPPKDLELKLTPIV